MEIKYLSDEELYAELELREVENNKDSLKECSQIDIGRDSYMIDYDFLLLNATTGDHNEVIVEVEDVDLHNCIRIMRTKYNDFSHLKEVYFYKTYVEAIGNHNVGLERYMDEHGKINISIFDILNCIKIVCGEDEYIAVCVDD